MFVIDALRRLNNGALTIPSFHLGHLGFRPGLEVESQYSEIKDAHGHITAHELTLTPFQARRKDLFLFKCIFKEQPGVVARALAAFAPLGLNVLSLESATIDEDSKHVAFCILSWASSKYPDPLPLEESAKYKYIDLLPLLPTFDQRYIILLQRFLVICFDSVEYEQVPGGRFSLPRISINMFYDFYSSQRVKALKIFREMPQQQFKLPSVKIDLRHGGAVRAPADNAYALLFSETETKALHVIFPQAGREKLFLHIGFTHNNRPGALLVIALLLQYSGFSIKAGLVRLYEHANDTNIWEVVIELVVPGVESIPSGRKGVEWFCRWCFGDDNPQVKQARELIPNLSLYNVKVVRPTYPRRYEDHDDEFTVIELIPHSTEQQRISKRETGHHFFLRGLTKMSSALSSKERGSWLAKLIYPNVMDRISNVKGQVFLSIPSHCELHIKEIEQRFGNELKLNVVTYVRPNASPLVSVEALNMIREADYYFGVWHHKNGKPGTLFPWLPFEFGAAKAMGKRFHLIAHVSIPDELTRRIDKDYALIKFDDQNFDGAITTVISACKRQWELE